VAQPQRHASIRHLNGLQLDSVAEFFWPVALASELEHACSWAREHKQSITVLGAGSNVVARPFIPGLVMQMAMTGVQLVTDDDRVVKLRAAAGEHWHDFVTWSVRQGLGGLENLALIPGTVGAAPVQNIGAYGVEVGEVISAVHIYDWYTQSYRWLTHDECLLGYRDSIFKTAQASTWIIVAVEFSLSRDTDLVLTYPELKAALEKTNLSVMSVYNEVVALRKKKLPDPLETPNVGSFFKNPIVDAATAKRLAQQWPALPQYPAEGLISTGSSGQEAPQPGKVVKVSAAWMIDYLGLRGRVHHGIAVYAKHALVIINTGGDIAALLTFAGEISALVEDHFGVQLSWEPRLIGVSGHNAQDVSR